MAIKFLNSVAVDTDVLFVDTANERVGIGTDSPSAKLHVQGGSSGYLFRVQGTSTLNVYDPGAAAEIGIGSSSGDKLKLFSNDSINNGITIDTTGNVGIGTSSPSTTLDVAGSITTSGALIGPSLFEIIAQYSNRGRITLSSSTSTGANQIALLTSGVLRMVVNKEGNVGIGTTSPTQLLDVAGADAEIVINDSNDAPALRFRGSGVTSAMVEVNSAKDMFFKTGGVAEQMRITSAGNVGIGTTSPGYKLEVDNSANAANNYIAVISNNSNNSGVLFRDAGGNRGLIFANPDNDLVFMANGTSEKMRINASGNVGIGTTSPSMKLEVSTDAEMVAKFTGNTDDGTGYVGAVVEIESNNDARGRGVYLTHRLTTDTSDSEWYAGVPYTGGGYSIGNAAYGTSVNSNTGPAHKDQSKLFITEAGNVGIGTTAPSEKLDVSGNAIVRGDIVARDTYPSIYVDHSGTVMGGIRADATSKLELKTLTTAPLSFQVNSSEKMRILDNGNVGIGTTSPGEPLTVKTKTDAYFPGIKVEDYNSTMGLYVQNIEGLNSGIGTGRYYNSGSWRSDVTVPTAIRLDGGAIRFYAQSGVTADVNYTPTQRMIINANGAISLNAYGNGSFGGSGGFLLGVNTSGGVYEANAADLPGGPYLPLAGGTMTGAITLIDGSTTETSINFTGDPNTGIYQPADNLMGFVSNGSRKLLVDTAGVTVQNGNLFINSDSSSSANNRIIMGAGNDLQIYHDGSNSYIDDTGTGHLVLNTNGASMKFLFGSEFMAQFEANGSVDLYHNNSKKFETTSTGVTVTGAATATTFLGDLNGTINTVTTAVTKANATNDTTVATTAFVQNLIGTIPAGLVFQGTWDAATNTPTLTSGSGTTGHFYIVSTSGSTNLDGVTDWVTGDWAVFIEQGATDAWEKIDNSSVLDGAGTGQTVALWSGSGTSNTLTDAPITVSGNNTTFAGNVSLTGGSLSISGDGSNAVTLTESGNGDFTIDAPDDIRLDAGGGDVVLRTGGTEFGRISSFSNALRLVSSVANEDILLMPNGTGNVGIGTTSPGEKLEVAGKTIIRRTGTATAQADTDLLVTDATAAGSTAQLEILGGNAGNSMLYFSDTDSYSQGAIQYLHSSDSMNFRVNASTAMSINSSRNVGIGTSSPNTALEVDGAISTTTSDYAQGTTGSRLLLETSGSGNTHSYIQAQSSGGTSNAEDLALQLYGGNVGIGTSSPGTKLHISAPGGSSQLTLERTGGGAGKAVLAGAAEGLIVYDDLYGPKMYVGTSGTYNGNVGIGTISPLTKLHIAGTNDANIIRIENTNTALSFGDTIGAIQFFNNDTTDDSPNVAASIYATAGASGGSGSLRFKTIEPGVEGDPATEAMIITNGGNVGIGTTSPSAKLHVSGDSSSGNLPIAKVESTGTISYLKFFNSSTGTGSSDGAYIGMNGGTAYFMNKEAGNLYLGTGDNFNLTLENGGNVGIGTTNPSYKLDVDEITSGNLIVSRFKHNQGGVASAMQLENRAGAVNSAFDINWGLNSSGNQGTVGVIRTNLPAAGGSEMYFKTSYGEVMRLDGAGNVGIGTTSPGATLHVQGTTLPQAKIGYDANNYVQVSVNGVGDTSIAPTGNGLIAPDLTLSAGSAYIKVDAQTNNVGIGTTTPDRPLSVVGGNSMVARFQSTNTTSFIQLSNTTSTADQVRIGSNGTNLVLSTNYTEKMRITSAGDTGIGVTTPRAKLDVAGGVKVANDTDTATANKEGTLRYRLAPDVPKSQSMVDMCMKTGPSSYAWVNIVTNTWNN